MKDVASSKEIAKLKKALNEANKSLKYWRDQCQCRDINLRQGVLGDIIRSGIAPWDAISPAQACIAWITGGKSQRRGVKKKRSAGKRLIASAKAATRSVKRRRYTKRKGVKYGRPKVR